MSDEDGVLDLIGRKSTLFGYDVDGLSDELLSLVKGSRFLVIGGAGSIGQAVTKEIFKRSPKVLHVVDINENNLVELVRSIRSTIGYGSGDFRTFAIDCGNCGGTIPPYSSVGILKARDGQNQYIHMTTQCNTPGNAFYGYWGKGTAREFVQIEACS